MFQNLKKRIAKNKRKKLLAQAQAEEHMWSEKLPPDPELVALDQENEVMKNRPISFQSPLLKSSFSYQLSDYTKRFFAGMQTIMFRRSSVLIIATGMVVGGLFLARSNYKQDMYELSMSTSPVDVSFNFALSGAGVQVGPQFINSDKTVFAIPIKFESFNAISTKAKDYSIILQGKTMPIDPETQAKLIIYGDSGDGAILIKGKFTGEPMNVYLQSNNSILGSREAELDEITEDDLTSMIASGDIVALQGLFNDEEQDGPLYMGTTLLNGYEVPVTTDVVIFSLNPLAQNVRPVEGLTFDMPYGELFENVLSSNEKDALSINIKNADKRKEELIDILRQYEVRLKSDHRFTDEQVAAILQVDEFSINSTGSQSDIKLMNAILEKGKVDEFIQADKNVGRYESFDDFDSDDYETALKEEASRQSSFNPDSDNTATPITELLDQVRSSIMSVNRQILLYEYRYEYLNDVAKDYDKMVSSVENYMIVNPYKYLKQN